jgi:WD40 repeat protein
VTSVIFSPNGSHIVSESSDCTIRIWDAVTFDSEIFSEQAILPDGTQVHHHPYGTAYFTPPLPPMISSPLSQHMDWIVHKNNKQNCWISMTFKPLITIHQKSVVDMHQERFYFWK